MKSKNILNIFLLISLLSGLFVFQPADVVQALPADQAQRNLTGLIAYIGQDGNVRLIYSDGSDKPLTNDGGYEGLTWSPNGLYLALTKGRSLLIKDLTDHDARRLSDDLDFGVLFAWDPSGDRIAYSSSEQIHIIDVHDVETEITIPATYPYKSLFWDSLGENIIYFSYDIVGIHSVNVNTKIDTPILLKNAPERSPHFEELEYFPRTGNFFGWDYQSEGAGFPVIVKSDGQLIDLGVDTGKAIFPGENNGAIATGYPSADWSPDGKRIAYNSNWIIGDGNLFIVDVDPYKFTAIKPTVGRGINPRWSPDGGSIAFTTEKGGLSLLDVASGGVEPLRPDVSEQYLTEMCSFGGCYGFASTAENEPRWSPDGKNIIRPFTLGFFIYNLESREEPKWVDGGISPEWQPTANTGITDLTIQPIVLEDVHKFDFPIKLSWQAPSIKKVTEYDVRFSLSLLSEASWSDAELLNGSLTRTESPIEFTGFLPPEYRNKNLHFGLKYRLANGQWSSISNIVYYIDSGFRSNVNGYQFTNLTSTTELWGIYPDSLTANDFTDQDFYQMFKDNTVLGIKPFCVPRTDTGTSCELFPENSRWVTQVNERTNDGRCLGMASTSSMIYYDPSLLGGLTPNVSYLYNENVNLNVEAVRKFIVYHHVEQWTQPFVDDFNNRVDDTPNVTLVNTQVALSERNNIMLIIFDKFGGQHAITPISVVRSSSNYSIIFAYNNEVPGKISPINIYPNGEWEMDNNNNRHSLGESYKLFVADVDVLNKPREKTFITSKQVSAWINAPIGSAYFEDAEGNRTGTIDGVFQNEIPDVQIMPIITNDDFSSSEPVYFLPVNNQYKIHVFSVEENLAPISIRQFGENYAITVDNIYVPNGGEDGISITPNGDQVTYDSINGQNLSVDFAFHNGEDGYVYKFTNIKTGADSELIIKNNMSQGKLILVPTSNEPFDLQISHLDSTGEKEFSHKGVQFTGAKSIAFDVSTWSGHGALDVQVDYDGDGKYDEVAKISNQESFIGRVISYKYSGFLFCGAGFALFLIGALGLVFVRRKVR